MSAKEIRPVGGGSPAISSKLDSTAGGAFPKHGLRHEIAVVTTVVGGRGNARHVLIYRCQICGHKHLSQGRGDLPAVIRRKGPHGLVLLHVITGSSAIAA